MSSIFEDGGHFNNIVQTLLLKGIQPRHVHTRYQQVYIVGAFVGNY